jgi:lysozyme family protein
MDAEQNKIIAFIILREGGYVNNPKDPGGETKYGISKRSYPELDISNLTLDHAKEIYTQDYYNLVVNDKMTFAQKAFMMDTAVNMGIGTARRFWQDGNGEVDKMLSLREQRYRDIVEKKPTSQIFLKGWLNRLTELCKFINSPS